MIEAEIETLTQTLRRWQPYADYKDSGVEWLGAIPAHWTVAPVYARYSVRLGKMLSPAAMQGGTRASYLRNANVQWDRVDLTDVLEMDFDPDERRKYALLPGDLLVCEGGEVGRTAIWHGELDECYIQNAVHRVRPLRSGEEGRFLFYVLFMVANRGVFRAYGNISTIVHLTAEKLRKHRFAFPPAKEQRAIAAFLDREAARLDALVAKKQRLIGLLREKRAALISHVVTRGLDPSAPLRESSVPWLGAIPAHWDVKPLKKCIRKGTSISYGIVQPGDHVQDGVPFIQTTNMTTGDFSLDRLQRTTSEIASRYPRSTLGEGDVLLAIRASIGAAHLVPAELSGANLSRGVARIVAGNELAAPFLVTALSSRYVHEYWNLACQGSTFDEVSIATVREIPVAIPPIHEQHAIVSFLNAKVGKIDTLVSAIQAGIEKLKEYRAALISAAVTGRIDVRQEAADGHLGAEL